MNKKIGIYLVLGIAVVAAGIFLLQPRDAEEDVRFDEIEHGHGLAVAIDDPERVYIATHEGLFAVVGGTLERIGKSEDDFMGFSVHPTDPNVFFTSGHPHDGGNLGFQKSEDKGITWKKISDGIDGPIDFHSMAVNAIDPTRVYGWYGNQFHRSADGGITWEAFDIATPTPIGFTTDPKNSQVIYAVTIRGVSVSKDEGKTWASLSSALSDQLVTAIVLHPEDDALIVFSRKKENRLLVSVVEQRGRRCRAI